MTSAIIFIRKDDGKFKACYIDNYAYPTEIGKELLRCGSDEQAYHTIEGISHKSYDCDQIQTIECAFYHYVRINEIWYMFHSSDPTLKCLKTEIEKLEKLYKRYNRKPKIKLKKNEYFEAIIDDEDLDFDDGESIAACSYATSKESGYKILTVRAKLEDNEIADFAKELKKAHVKSFAYPFSNIDKVTGIFSEIGYIRNGFHKEKNYLGTKIMTPKFTYYPHLSKSE